MSQLKARCIDQVLMFENTPVITSGNVNYDSIVFDFCSAWDGFIKTAIFYRSEDEVFYQLLDEANTCIIPKEVLKDKGDVYIGVFGVNGDTTLTSQVLKYKVAKGAITENLKPADPTPDIYSQIVSRYDAVIKELEEQKEKLEDLQSQFTGSIGNAETLGGFGVDHFATAQSVKDLEDGTKKAGDSNKLGGHETDYFATAQSVENLTNGTTTVKKASEAENASKLGNHNEDYFATAQSVADLESGTKKAGDANKFGGHEVGYFAKAEINLGKLAIAESALDTLSSDHNLPNYLTYTATIVPQTVSSNQYLFGGASFSVIGMEYGSYKYGYQLGISGEKLKVRGRNNERWSEWVTIASLLDLANYLPLDGSKPITGNVFKWMNGYSGVTGSNVHTALVSWNNNNDINGDGVAVVLYNGTDPYSPNKLLCQIKKNGVATNYDIHHDGNSAKVHIGASAPSDTTGNVLFINTSK